MPSKMSSDSSPKPSTIGPKSPDRTPSLNRSTCRARTSSAPLTPTPSRSGDREDRRLPSGADAHSRGHGPGQRAHRFCRQTRLALCHGRDADVAALADLDVDRDPAEELEVALLGEP